MGETVSISPYNQRRLQGICRPAWSKRLRLQATLKNNSLVSASVEPDVTKSFSKAGSFNQNFGGRNESNFSTYDSCNICIYRDLISGGSDERERQPNGRRRCDVQNKEHR